MQKLKTNIENPKAENILSYYCYDCSRITQISNNLDNEHNITYKIEFICKHCNSEFIEKTQDIESFIPSKIESFTPPSNKPQSEKTTKSRNDTDRPSTNNDNQDVRVVRKTIRLSYHDPFVRDVLLHAVPHIFRRANLERIQMVRNFINSIASDNQNEEGSNGPASKEYIETLERYKFKDYDQIEKFLNCPICTENFDKEDVVMSIDCGHTFHDECLLPWLDLNNTCPNCRFVLPKREV